METKKLRFQVGQTVMVKEDLMVGRHYYSEDKMVRDIFIEKMVKYKGVEAEIISISCGKYILDIDNLFQYTCDMLELIEPEYEVNEEVEELIKHVQNKVRLETFKKLIDEALDSGDKEKFNMLVEEYNKSKK